MIAGSSLLAIPSGPRVPKAALQRRKTTLCGLSCLAERTFAALQDKPTAARTSKTPSRNCRVASRPRPTLEYWPTGDGIPPAQEPPVVG